MACFDSLPLVHPGTYRHRAVPLGKVANAASVIFIIELLKAKLYHGLEACPINESIKNSQLCTQYQFKENISN